ncbi:MAG TPA: hypothetical protein VE954_27520 [Oligoflexus sp.]|uniref:hypothetical protein n=1 Tax=Oligoflexus sp. TaxID=1971216 RepID=UPI002D6C098E|nr:hypothetical protein [Oligoflexus sp.]HYX36875.1 hypothetical protein [Oligoflexus sp.]
MLVTQWFVELLKMNGIDCVIYSSVAVGLKEPELNFKIAGKLIEYYNLCALKPEKWKMTKNSPKVVKVRSMSVVAMDDNTWIDYQALTELAKDPELGT